MPLPSVSLYIRGHDCTLFEAREERLLGSLRMQRIISRLADALMVMDSRLVIRVENMVTTSSLEVLGVDLNGTMSKYFQLSLLVLDLNYFLHFPSSEYVDTIKRLCRKLLYMYNVHVHITNEQN